MTTNEHLQKILAKCRENLALAEKRTPGKWEVEESSKGGIRAPSDHILLYSGAYLDKPDRKFIATCAGAAEASWRSTIAAIEGLLTIVDFVANSSREYQTKAQAHLTAAAILAAWPEELL